jgi:hypothetical protein
MKISKITYKNKEGKTCAVNLSRNDGITYDVFFIYGPPGSGKSYLCKLISDAWQLNMFHGESKLGASIKGSDINIEGSFSDLHPIVFGIPSKLSNKNLIASRVQIDQRIKNSILYYPWNRHTCTDETIFAGETITNAYMPMADLSDDTIQNCCLIIDNAARGMNEQESAEYIKILNELCQKNKNQIILFMDSINCGSVANSNRSHCLGQQTMNGCLEECKKMLKDLKLSN